MIDSLETQRIILRPFTYDDAEAMFLLGSIPEIIRYTGNHPFQTLNDAKAYLTQHPLNDYRTYGYGRYACELKETGQVIGFCGLKFLRDIDETELGYRFLPEHWGKGYATETGAVVAEYAQSFHKLNRIAACVHPENHASKHVLQKLGFHYEKIVDAEFVKEHPVELFVKAL